MVSGTRDNPPPELNLNLNFIDNNMYIITKLLAPATSKMTNRGVGKGYTLTTREKLNTTTLAEVTFSLFLSKIQPAVYIRTANSSRGARQLGWASCLISAGRVTLAALARLWPDRDISRRGECHVMLRFRIYSRNSYQRSKN